MYVCMSFNKLRLKINVCMIFIKLSLNKVLFNAIKNYPNNDTHDTRKCHQHTACIVFSACAYVCRYTSTYIKLCKMIYHKNGNIAFILKMVQRFFLVRLALQN
jgi:hypothetical protein